MAAWDRLLRTDYRVLEYSLTLGGLSEGVPSGLCRSHTLIFESMELTAATECTKHKIANHSLPQWRQFRNMIDPAAAASSDHSPSGAIAQA